MKREIIAAAALITVGIIAGCSGSGGTGMSISTPAATTTVSGKVADGYLVGATVFLDRNRNYLLDAGEPSTTSDGSGGYTLNIDPADVGQYPIVALAIKDTTIDLDTNQPVQSSYVLSMHAVSVSPSATGSVTGSVGNFISPISTQLREMMETGKYETVQQAADELRVQLGMPQGMNVQADYVRLGSASSDDPNRVKYQAMHQAARNMASLMGGQMQQVMGAGAGAATAASTANNAAPVDVDRYRAMMGGIFSNISSVKGPNAQSEMTTLMGAMTSTLSAMPMTAPGQPFRNMSSAFRGGMGGMMTARSGGMMK
ncbi:MAG: hypothetical protein HYV06_11170 [Deltaproteobacteria bacterium]|nr:hypothetical protein [Deltaproteobacteria bacterium]